MPRWIEERAKHLQAKNPSMPEGQAFAIATQQSHALGKSPKNYGTVKGRAVAKAKYKTPEDDEKRASLESFLDELEKIAYGSEPTRTGGFLLASHGRASIPLRTPTPRPGRNLPIAGMTKEEDFDFTYSPGDFRPVNINRKHASPQWLLHMIYNGDVKEAKKGRTTIVAQGGTAEDIAAHDEYIRKHLKKHASTSIERRWARLLERRPDLKKKAAALTPAGRLASTRNTGMAAGSFLRKGPSVAEISKPHGFGKPLAGATKI